MKIKPKPIHFLYTHWYGYNSIHDETEWANEQEETEKYVMLLCQALGNGGSIAETTLGDV